MNLNFKYQKRTSLAEVFEYQKRRRTTAFQTIVFSEICSRNSRLIDTFFVYQLKCANGCPYTGCTNNLEARLERHAKGYVFSTKDKLPFELEMYVAFNDKYKAFAFEKYLKSGSGRAFAKRHF